MTPKVARFANQHIRKLPYHLREDAWQEARIAAWKAESSWRADGGASADTLQCASVHNQIKNIRRYTTNTRRFAKTTPLESPMNTADGEIVGDEKYASDDVGPEELLSDAERKYAAQQLLSLLPAREADILYRHFWKDESCRDIGVTYGFCRARIQQIVNGSLAVLRKKLLTGRK